MRSAWFLFVASLFVISHGEGAEAGRKLPVIIITVDVESTEQNNRALALPEQTEAICAGEIPCGLQQMVGILKKKGYGATFFLNVFEYRVHGEAFLQKTGKWLLESGQDVQLHTHPQWQYDPNRNMMYQYTLDEQVTIIREGKKLLEKWTGRPVVAHRAGSYSGDENTLKALIVNGIFYDSSLFYGHPESRINALALKKNALSMYGPLYEFPVTVYKKDDHPFFAKTYLRPHSSIRKYDVNWFGDQKEAEKAFQEAIQLRMDFIIVFLHSYSFIKGRNEAGQMTADVDAIKGFEKILDFIGVQGLDVRTFKQISDRKADLAQYLNTRDVVPEISVQIPTMRYIRKLAGVHKHNYKGVILYFGLFLASVAVSSTILKWRADRNDRTTRERHNRK